MFKATALILSLTAALQLVWASSVEITSPEPNAVWEAGSTVQIKWKVNEANSKPLRIQYASGPSKALKINGLIADKVDASVGHYNWKIPSGLKAKKYVIEVGPSASDLSFAGYIHVVSKGKKTTTQKHTTKKHTTKKHTTKKHTTKKHSTAKKSTTKKPTTKKGGEAVCIGKPTKGDKDAQAVRCQSVPKAAPKKKVSKKHTTKKHTTKKHTTKKHTTKKHTTVKKD